MPIKDSEQDWTFDLRVLPSERDSIYIILENHTNLKAYLYNFPRIQAIPLPKQPPYRQFEHEIPPTHPIFLEATNEGTDWLQAHTTLYGGNAIRLSLPTSWDLDSIPRLRERVPYKSLPNGRYKVNMNIEIHIAREFEIKEIKTSN